MNGQFCSTCGALNVPFARFCDACGARLPSASGVACPSCGRPALPGDRFCDECGAALPATALLILEDSGWRLALPSVADQTDVVIGREDVLSGVKPDIDLAPHGAETYGVSRSHAYIGRNADGYRVEDLGSVNLTYLNDQRLEPGRSAPLKDGDRITIGNLRLLFRQV